MASATLVTNSFISTITGFTAVGEARYGTNGQQTTPPEYDVSDANGNSVSGNIVWDDDPNEPFDSGDVEMGLNAAPGGGSSGVSWSVAGGTVVPVVLTTVTYGAIQQVQIRAAVQIAATATWRSVVVEFYKAGVLMDSYNRRIDPAVDTTGSPSPVAKEQILTVTPNANNNDQVIVTGSFELACAEGVNPGPNDIFGQVFLFA